ncbi:MAG: hypothetical protein KGI71_05115 [Patescibacteria group bacterium]|nr:hypothetical protein [Patescibacteria group bacterium]
MATVSKSNMSVSELMKGRMPRNAGVIDYLRELLDLGPAQLTTAVIEFMVTLGATAGAGGVAKYTDSDKYRVPGDRDLIIFQVQGGFRSTAIITDLGVTAPSPSNFANLPGLIGIRLANCAVQLYNQDRHLNLIDGGDNAGATKTANLGAFTPPNGAPIYFPANAPLIVPASHNLAATFTLKDTGVNPVGANAEYKLVLSGILLPRKS